MTINGNVSTEQPNPNTQHIDKMSTLEIVQQIHAEDQTVTHAVRDALPQIALAIDGIVARLERGGRLIYIGAGTSGRLGVLDAVECVPTFSVSPDLVQGIIAGGYDALIHSVEDVEDDPQLSRADLQKIGLSELDVVAGIAASGRTPYTIGAVEYANSLGALSIGIACNVPAPLLDLAQIPIGVVTGPEVITGSTRLKAGTAQKMILNMLSSGAMIRLGKVYNNLMVDVKISNEKLAKRALKILMHVTRLPEAEASEMLRAAGFEVKTAIVMHQRQVSAGDARRLLDDVKGHLRDLIG